MLDIRTLENDKIRIEVVPALGGKIISFYNKEAGFEYCVVPNKEKLFEVSEGDRFIDHEISGIDECFPNVDGEEIEFEKRRLCFPDHGEVWKNKVSCTGKENRLEMHFDSAVFGYSYHKVYELENDHLKISYHIEKTTDDTLPCLWTFHGVFKYEKNSQLFYPKEINRFQNVLIEATILGEQHKYYPFPSEEYDFSRIPDLSKEEYHFVKYYCPDALSEGYCKVTYPEAGCALEIDYDSKTLPYLGVWIDEAGVADSENFAFEMTNGYYDKISKALKNKKIGMLKKGDTMDFYVSLFPKML